MSSLSLSSSTLCLSPSSLSSPSSSPVWSTWFGCLWKQNKAQMHFAVDFWSISFRSAEDRTLPCHLEKRKRNILKEEKERQRQNQRQKRQRPRQIKAFHSDQPRIKLGHVIWKREREIFEDKKKDKEKAEIKDKKDKYKHFIQISRW